MSARIINDGFSDVHLYYVVGTSDFPAPEFSLTWQSYISVLRAASGEYQTHCGVASLTFGGGNEYWVAFDGAAGVNVNFAIGSDGNDSYAGVAQVAGRWYRQAFRHLDIGGGTIRYEFYYDLDGGLGNVVTRNNTDGIAYASDARFFIGNVPYTTNEGVDGLFRSFKVWSDAKSTDVLLAESRSGYPETPQGATSLWAQWPLRFNGLDISGNNRHLTSELQGAAGSPAPSSWLTFDGAADPAHSGIRTMDRIRRPAIFSPGLARH